LYALDIHTNKKLSLLQVPTDKLSELVKTMELEATDHLQIVVGKGRVLLKQVFPLSILLFNKIF
jgi:hypothetical protein